MIRKKWGTRMEKNRQNYIDVSEICLLAGEIMLASGAETYRVEDTMVRIAHAYGVKNAESYVTPTAIIFAVNGELYPAGTKMKRIERRTTDLNKIATVNSLSREISEGKWTIESAYERLKQIKKENISFSVPIQILAAGIASGCFVIMFLGKWIDVLPGIVAGSIGYFCFLTIHQIVKVRFFSELVSSLIIGFTANIFVYAGIGDQADKIIIGSVMPLVPGLLITNAIRDLMVGHLISGLAKGAEALLTAFAIGAGIAVAYAIF
ncbi:hypothetical protein B4064_1151 [Caldibacillus thermoamylovorans]|nr:hypothetical protein B4064_1151 [Caldibacillus thermoamylovorans]